MHTRYNYECPVCRKEAEQVPEDRKSPIYRICEKCRDIINKHRRDNEMEKNNQKNTQKIKRLEYLKEELEKAMPSVINALALGFYPANYKRLENMAQEYESLKSELSL